MSDETLDKRIKLHIATNEGEYLTAELDYLRSELDALKAELDEVTTEQQGQQIRRDIHRVNRRTTFVTSRHEEIMSQFK